MFLKHVYFKSASESTFYFSFQSLRALPSREARPPGWEYWPKVTIIGFISHEIIRMIWMFMDIYNICLWMNK